MSDSDIGTQYSSHENNVRYYLAEIGANYRGIFPPTPKQQLGLIMSVLAHSNCMVVMERIGSAQTTQELLPGPGEAPNCVPVNGYIVYPHPAGTVLYFSEETGIDTCGEYQLLYMCCSECGEEITTADDESEKAYELDGLCPKCYFEDAWTTEQNKKHADRLHAEHERRELLDAYVPGLGEIIHPKDSPFPTSYNG